jgi:predicted NUDIX family NTP pyrophosphohydrolase
MTGFFEPQCPNGNCPGEPYWSRKYGCWRCPKCGWMGEVEDEESEAEAQ